MGVLSQLGFEARPANILQQLVQKVSSSRPGAWFFARTLYVQDKVLFKATKGRLTVPTLLAGLPVLMLTTTGAKTGKRRTMPLVGIPIDDDLAIIGSNYGQKNTPGWVYNLEADPTATVEYRDRTIEVVARRADDHEAVPGQGRPPDHPGVRPRGCEPSRWSLRGRSGSCGCPRLPGSPIPTNPKGTTMDLVAVVDLISSFEDWKVIFDEDAEERAKFAESWLVGQTDEEKVIILARNVDLPAMAAFMGTPEFAERAQPYQSGVTLYGLSEMAPPA